MTSWIFISRFGEAQILLPIALAMCLWLARRDEARPVVVRWLACMCAAAIVTTITKVAFLGWGIGSAALDFTGISGHSMFSAAVYPPLFYLTAAAQASRWRKAAWLSGFVLALIIGISRVTTGTHSWSEVVAGLIIGSAVSLSTLWIARSRHAGVPLWLPVGMGVWLAVTPVHAPASTTHDLVTRLALKLSGRQTPHTREELRRHGYPLSVNRPQCRVKPELPVSRLPASPIAALQILAIPPGIAVVCVLRCGLRATR